MSDLLKFHRQNLLLKWRLSMENRELQVLSITSLSLFKKLIQEKYAENFHYFFVPVNSFFDRRSFGWIYGWNNLNEFWIFYILGGSGRFYWEILGIKSNKIRRFCKKVLTHSLGWFLQKKIHCKIDFWSDLEFFFDFLTFFVSLGCESSPLCTMSVLCPCTQEPLWILIIFLIPIFNKPKKLL